METLGKGAFGEVWKVRNKLDRRLYAVKRVTLFDDERLNAKIKREVTTISRLFHKYVVRYYAAWIEEDVGSQTDPGNFGFVHCVRYTLTLFVVLFISDDRYISEYYSVEYIRIE